MTTPVLLAFCRDCVGDPTPSPTCWRCGGQVLYRVHDALDADFVFGLVREGAAFGIGMQPTARLRAWLREVSDAP